jgi:hypothetical protein
MNSWLYEDRRHCVNRGEGNFSLPKVRKEEQNEWGIRERERGSPCMTAIPLLPSSPPVPSYKCAHVHVLLILCQSVQCILICYRAWQPFLSSDLRLRRFIAIASSMFHIKHPFSFIYDNMQLSVTLSCVSEYDILIPLILSCLICCRKKMTMRAKKGMKTKKRER